MSGNAEAENLMGLAYIDGKKGCVQNRERGIRWLKKAAAAPRVRTRSTTFAGPMGEEICRTRTDTG